MTIGLSTCDITGPSDQKLTECKFFRTVKPDCDDCCKQQHVHAFTHPEVSNTAYGIKHIKEKLPIGIALSGGGFRAATCAVGFMRGIHKTKLDNGHSLLSQVQYLSSTSGGSWFNAAFSYKPPRAEKQLNLDTFLGPHLQAGELTEHRLNSDFKEGSFEAVIAENSALDGLLGDTVNLVKKVNRRWALAHPRELFMHGHKEVREAPWVRDWTRAVTESFLEPFNLDIYNSTVSALGTEGDIHTRAQEAADNVLLACSDQHRPYPILTGTVCNDTTDDGWPTYPLEFAPLYFGTAAAFPKSDPPLGGGFVEPWGLNAKPVALKCDGDGCTGSVDFERTGHPVPLAQAMAISSGFMAAGAHDKYNLVKNLTSTEELFTWGLMEGPQGAAPPAKSLGFADGGALDNYAIMPLLRRGVKCLIVLVSSSTPPDDTWQRFRDECMDIAALFGIANTNSATPGLTPGMLNDMCHVFGEDGLEGEEHFRRLFQDLHQKLRKGQPGFHCASYKIKENEFFHIPKDQEGVTVLWIYNQQFAGWEAKLPTETYTRLQEDRDCAVHHQGTPIQREANTLVKELAQLAVGNGFKQDKLDRFPYFSTYSLDWEKAPVRLLSQMHTAIVMDPAVQDAIKELVTLAKAKKQAAPPSPSSSSSVFRPATPEQR